MRPSLRVLASLTLALAVAAPTSGVVAAGGGEESITGVLEMAQVDGVGGHPDRVAWTVRSGHRVIPVDFESDTPRTLTGARVTITGTRSGGVLRVASGRPGRSLQVRERTRTTGTGDWAAETMGGASTAGGGSTAGLTTTSGTSTAVNKSVALVMFNFSDVKTQPYTKAQMQDALLGASGMKAFFEEESKGRLSVTGAVFGWYTIDATTAGCSWPTWHTLAWNAATAAGVNLDAYTNVMFLWPQTSQCGFAGVGYVPGKYTYLNGTNSVQVMTHEFGHNLGLSHSNALNCTSGGTRVTIAAPSACTTKEYADPFSTMGNNALRHDHGSHLGELGWLTSAEKVVGGPGKTYTIAPYFGAAGVKLVRVPRGDGTFFDLDLRMPYGAFDTFTAGSPAVAGVTIRVGVGSASPTTSPKQTLLLDTTPGTTDLKDAPLLVGRTMTDPVSSISITAVSIGSAGIVVRVREGIAPTAPGSVAGTGTTDPSARITWSPAGDNVAVASYKVRRGGTVVATVGASAGSYTDTTAALGATYTYAVSAVDTSGNAGPAASVTVAMPAAPALTPTPVPTPGATPAPEPSSSPAAVPAPTPTPKPTVPPAPTPTPTPSPTPDPGTARGPDTQAPTTPGGLAGVTTTTSVSLAWRPASDDIGVVGYRVSRNGRLVASPSGTAWKDTGRAPLTSYTYLVAALDAVGNVGETSSVTVKTLADTARPTTPRSFRRIARSGRYVTFDWLPSTDNVKVAKYYVYRVGRSTPVATARYSRIRIATLRGAYYYVKAVDASGNRSYRSAKVRGRR